MTERVPSGLMRGRWRRSDGPLEGDTRPKWGETAGPRTPWTPRRQCPTPLVGLCRGRADPKAARKFTQIDLYVWQRLGLFLARRRGVRRHRHGAVTRWSFAWFWGLGLYRLLGTVRYPDPAHV